LYGFTYFNSALNKNIKETINLSDAIIGANKIRISDDDKSGSLLEFIDFSITKWELATTSDTYKNDYPIAFKITGKITGANPADANSNYIYGNGTAPGFNQSDINNTECWMYICISNDGKFIRSPFSKTGKDNGVVPVQLNTNPVGALRVYTKTP